MDNMIMAYDGDNAGRMVGQAILANNEQALSEASERIAHGHDIVKQWVESHGGKIISGGGDEGTFSVPAQAVGDIETLRKDYEFATQLTMTVGVGATLSEAGKALMVGKVRGKNQVVQYDPSIDQEYAQIGEHAAAGTGTDEENKLGEAYMQKEEAGDDCKYCAEMEDHGDDCQYCAEHDAAKAGEADCKYCAEADAAAAAPDHEHTDDCQYCAEAEAQAQGQGGEHEHTGDDCQYCEELNAIQGADNEENPEIQGEASGEEALPPSENQEGMESNPESPQETIEEVASQIETDSPETQTERGVMDNIDADEAALGTEMQDNVSRPDTFDEQNVPGDMGLAEDEVPEESPDLSEVLRGGLDNHAEAIQKEKVVQLVSHALEGFKAQKAILEKAKDQAPQLYESTIAMLKAMIEMAKMLGLGPSQTESGETVEQEGEEVVGDQPAEQNEWHDPFPTHPDHAAAQEDAAPGPFPQGQ